MSKALQEYLLLQALVDADPALGNLEPFMDLMDQVWLELTPEDLEVLDARTKSS